VGEIAVSVFDRLNIDVVFMGAHGMDVASGFSSPNLLEAETNRAVQTRAKKLVVLADHTKWGEVAFSTFANLTDANTLITDDGLSEEALNQLRKRIGDVQVVVNPKA
jgi:DeoR/GlpR family transcriptional regulator of sugar metabolism